MKPSIDPNEHVYITSYRKLGYDDKQLPDIHALMPWARDRLHRQGEEARKRLVEQRVRKSMLSNLRGFGPAVKG